MTIGVRFVVWSDTGGGEHPGVVIRVRPTDGALLVLPGTGTSKPLPRVAVEHGTRAWRGMRLSKDTFFYGPMVAMAEASVTHRGGMCPPNVFQKMRELVSDVDPPA